MDYAIQQMVNALSFGAEYALLALGLAIVFSVMGLVNFAHGDVIAVGGYTMVAFAAIVTANPWIVILGAIVAAALTSVLLERVAFRPVRYADPTTGLLTAFGVSIVLQNLFLLFVSPRPIAVTSLYFMDVPIEMFGVQVSSLQLLESVTTVLVIVGLTLFLNRSVWGLAMRAASLDFEMVRLMGIRANRVFALAFLISGLLAGLACIFIMARRGSVDPHLGFNPVLKAFVACVVGGFGSLPGAVLGGFLLGAVEVGMLVLLPQEYGGMKDAFVFGIIALILVWRPNGILSPAVEKGDKL
ncbi:branched-chain amino acid ABC transporter permease [Alphaproteobacteria bacterium GH1-50]|uniref:Branched-chain amino acid ABC transporter permease n=1 Tax=Kangsaoukella pontilimi TaxID=2691042 RepID=A0A7C9MC82_9RHOB|nr:branched-chain amino acid ABC transporter permease [Kangsaoukella pontilimi]MXQ07391.1 branched-chain amino acid ABC transporter permease [Kangsaoukella pontilimi]